MTAAGFIVILIFTILSLVGAIVTTVIMVPPIRRVNDFEASTISFDNIQLDKRYIPVKTCDGCKISIDNTLPFCDLLDKQIAQISAEKCLDNTGPCPEARNNCRDSNGCCKETDCARSTTGSWTYPIESS